MIINSSFNKKEIEKVRGVILSEIRSSKDDIEDFSFTRINECAFNESPLKFDVAGLEENIKKYKREDLLNFYKKYYTPNNTVIAMVSSYSHEEALNEIKKYFSKWEERNITVKEIVKEKNIEKTFTTIKSNIEQNTIIYLYTFDNLKKELELPLKILNHRLGESSNSLLFREVREKRGFVMIYIQV